MTTNLPTMRQRRLTRYAQEEQPDDETVRAIARAVSRLGVGEAREPGGSWDETAPDGTPIMQSGIPAWERPAAERLPAINHELAQQPAPEVLPKMRQQPAPAPSDSPAADVREVAEPLPRMNAALADAYTRAEAPVAPEPLPVMRSGYGSGPVVKPSDRRDLGPVPTAFNAKGEAITRPEMDSTGDERTDLMNYSRALQMFRNPKDRDGRFWSTLKSIALGGLQGFAQTGSFAGGLGGAISGGVHGAASPNWNERAARDAESARVTARVAQLDAEDRQRLERESAAASVDAKNAAAARDRAFPVMKAQEDERKAAEGSRRLDALERRLDITEAYNKGRLDNDGRRIDETGRHNKVGEEDKDLDRDSRERVAAENRASAQRIAQWHISAQKEIAAQAQSIQRDRLKLSADQFQKRYPGAGFELTKDDIAKKAAAAGILPEEAAKLAVRQGYVIK